MAQTRSALSPPPTSAFRKLRNSRTDALVLMEGAAVVIVGAGLAGASCASVLARALGAAAAGVRVLDKARRPGGRMATKEEDSGTWDYGAQFFTVRSEEFAAETASWHSAREWCRGFAEQGDGYPRWVGARGMNGLVADLWARLPVVPECSSRVEAISRNEAGRGFSVRLKSGDILAARHVVLTCPVPQSLALVARIAHTGPEPLRRVRYAKTLSVQLLVDGRARLRAPGGLQRPCNGVHFVASSSQKGICSIDERGLDAWTVHMDADFSEECFELSEKELEPRVVAALAPLAPAESIVKVQSVHRWRYAIPTVLHPERYLECAFEDSSTLVFCGDAFQESRVEGAFFSGAAAGRQIASRYRAAL